MVKRDSVAFINGIKCNWNNGTALCVLFGDIAKVFVKNLLRKSILIIHRFCICRFIYSVKFLCNPKINVHRTFAFISAYAESSKVFESPTAHVPSGGEQGTSLPSSLIAHTVNKCSFGDLFHATLFYFFLCVCVLLVGNFFV